MGDFQRGGNRGGGFRGGNGGGFRGGNGGGRPSFGGGRGGDRGPVTMHKAVCDECHKSCEVPFRPSGDKPIYCNECFGSKKGGDDRGPRKDFGGDRAPRRDFSNDRPAPSQPSMTKPASVGLSEDMKNQFREINAKIDRLANAIEKMISPKVAQAQSPAVKAVVKKVEAKPVVKVAPKKVEVKKAKAVKVVSKKKTK